MNKRLPPRAGEWIDRSQPVEFLFEGQTFHGFDGDVLSSALWANGVRTLGRSFKYHRPRGLFSLANHDVNVMVEDGQRTNMRGDVLPIRAGLDVRAVNTIGGLKRDWLKLTEWFSRFLPVGFYYKAFHTPRRLFRFYENQMRKVAGLGRINPNATRTHSPKDYAFCDLLVVGAGPAGLAGAIAAAEQGVQVLLVDEQRQPGGSLAWQWSGDSDAQATLDGLIEQCHEHDNLQIRCQTEAGGWYPDHWIALFDGIRMTKLRAKAMLVAAGCFEQPAVFQNNDLPGVMLGSAAQRLINLYAVKPCERAVFMAANSDGYRVTLDLHNAGVDVAMVVDLRPEGEQTPLAQQVADANIRILNGHAVYECIRGTGNKGVGGAVVCRCDAKGQPQIESKQRVDCDGVIVSVGWAPNVGLGFQAGARFTYSDSIGQFVPREIPPGIFFAGRANGVFDLDAQIDDGMRAGLMAAAELGRFDDQIPEPPAAEINAASHPYPIFEHPGRKNFVDLDEDLHLVDFQNAHHEGYDNIELIKRYTTVGMGPSQGKLSNTNAVRILAALNKTSINQTGSTTSRPFYHPVPIGHLAGRCFHPIRRTSLHDWHVQHDAEMIHVGAWLRPEFYTTEGKHRADSIVDEAHNVRNNVGIIDVGTLGKLHINGPDAARFLEHIYTARFSKQPTGRLRYGLACDELGIIIEDGVVARLDDDRFYVTATSSGAAAFDRELRRWALILDMDVVIVNATGHLAAMNIAGPQSRDVLQALTDVDLTSEAFPYLGVREGIVADAPAVLMRVGFVGELGYEIHVPASFGLHVWKSLIDAGSQFGISPFGVEAQRLLRLEKGHLIVGQDTDALTNPFEADVAWAIGKNKSFFVGGRSLEIEKTKPLTRRLVGIEFPSDYSGPLPDECHLIIEHGEIAGRITSIAPRSTLGRAIALGFIRPDMSTIGTKIQVRIDDGQLVQAEVAQTPFYDPENLRQN